MRAYIVTRPYCAPETVVLMAWDHKHAKEICNEKFGFCSNMKARTPKKGILLTSGETPSSY